MSRSRSPWRRDWRYQIRSRASPPSNRPRGMDQPLSPPTLSKDVPSSIKTNGLLWLSALLRPILGFRLAYLPLAMIYFAYGALGLIDVSRDMWIKERLTLSPAELAGIAVWLSLPWTVKMVFGELVDSLPIFGSQRKAYVLIGAAGTASGMLTLAGAAGGWIAFARPDHLYILGAMLIVIGTVIQDVVADAMSTEVVSRRDGAGNPRAEEEVRAELGMVQVIGRLALSFGILAVAGLSGWLASMLARETVFLLGLVVPAVSVIGVLLIRSEFERTAPARLAHSRGRRGIRRRDPRPGAGLGSVQPRAGLHPLDGGHLHDAGVRHQGARIRRPGAPSCLPASSSSLSAPRLRSATATSGGRSTSSISTRRSTARSARPRRSSPSPPCGSSASS